MDLLDVRGVGPATKERLSWAGILTADDLARVRDVHVVSEWTGIAPARLAVLVEEAMKATAPRPPAEALRDVWAATTRLVETMSRSVASVFNRGRAT